MWSKEKYWLMEKINLNGVEESRNTGKCVCSQPGRNRRSICTMAFEWVFFSVVVGIVVVAVVRVKVRVVLCVN